MAEESVRILIEVVAGVIPKQPLPEYTQQWCITESDWEASGQGDKNATMRVLLAYGASREYAAHLEDHRKVNWVERTWLYL